MTAKLDEKFFRLNGIVIASSPHQIFLIMIAQTPWVGRTFNFDFPAGLYPCILERLRGTPARVQELVKGIPDEVLSRKINGKWSVKEHIGHLYDLEELHERRMREYIDGSATLTAADMQNRKTEEAQHNSKSIDSLCTQLRIERMQIVQQLEQVSDDLLVRKALHPRLKVPMRLVDIVYFFAEHDDHHLAKMRINIALSFD